MAGRTSTLRDVVDQLRESNRTLDAVGDVLLESATYLQNLQDFFKEWLDIQKMDRLKALEEAREKRVSIPAKEEPTVVQEEKPLLDWKSMLAALEAWELLKKHFIAAAVALAGAVAGLTGMEKKFAKKLSEMFKNIKERSSTIKDDWKNSRFNLWLKELEDKFKLRMGKMMTAIRETSVFQWLDDAIRSRISVIKGLVSEANVKFNTEFPVSKAIYTGILEGIKAPFQLAQLNMPILKAIGATLAEVGRMVGSAGQWVVDVAKFAAESTGVMKYLGKFFDVVGKIMRPIAVILSLFDAWGVGADEWMQTEGQSTIDRIIKTTVAGIGGFFSSFIGQMVDFLKDIPIWIIKKMFPGIVGADGKIIKKGGNFATDILAKIEKFSFANLITDIFKVVSDSLIYLKNTIAYAIDSAIWYLYNATGKKFDWLKPSGTPMKKPVFGERTPFEIQLDLVRSEAVPIQEYNEMKEKYNNPSTKPKEREEIKKWLDDNKPAYELNVKKYNIDNKKLQDMLKSQTKAGGASGTVAYNDSSVGDTFNNQNVATVNNYSIATTNDNSMRFLG